MSIKMSEDPKFCTKEIGWECPRCYTINAPSILVCSCHKKENHNKDKMERIDE